MNVASLGNFLFPMTADGAVPEGGESQSEFGALMTQILSEGGDDVKGGKTPDSMPSGDEHSKSRAVQMAKAT